MALSTTTYDNRNAGNSAGNSSWINITDIGTPVDNVFNETDKIELNSNGWLCTKTKTFHIMSLVVVTVVVIGAYFGNTLILMSLNRFRDKFKGSLYMLIGNLAVADMFLALGLSLHVIELTLPSLDLTTNYIFCAVKMCFTKVSLLNSGITLMCMSLDRFCAITFPMHHFLRHRQRRRMWAIISIIWTVSILGAFIPTMATVKSLKQHQLICRYGACVPRGLTIVAVAFLLFEMVFNIVLCCLVVWRVKVNSQTATRTKRKSMRSKSVLLIKVYVIFVLCWLPFIVLTVILESNVLPTMRSKLLCYREYMLHLGMLNSAMNWIVYGLGNNRFRQSFRSFVCYRTNDDNRSSLPS